MKEMIENIRAMSEGIVPLYVEDNPGLRENIEKLLTRLFKNVILAGDGEEGYRLFLKHNCNIVITDLNMPKMNGFVMIQKIRAVAPETKVIIMSAFDDKKHLHQAIDLGVFRYLTKPSQIPDLLNALLSALKQIEAETERQLFLNQMQNMLNYQTNLVIMVAEGQIRMANQRFFEFFGVDDLDAFHAVHPDIGSLLQPQENFLSSTASRSWIEQACAHPGVLFHTRINSRDGSPRHLILNAREIPQKKGHHVLSFDDITALNLLDLFNVDDAPASETESDDHEKLLKLLQIVRDNNAEVKIHNFYKGLTIVNPAKIVSIEEGIVQLKTAYAQLKIVKLQRYLTISSEIFPHHIVCRSIESVDVEQQLIVIKQMNAAKHTASDRKFIRLEPESDHRCVLFFKELHLTADPRVIDISEVSVKLSIQAIPPRLEVGMVLKLSVALDSGGKELTLVTPATLYRIDEHKETFHLVLLFELTAPKRQELKEYLAHRQMGLIREFKRMDIEQAPTGTVDYVI